MAKQKLYRWDDGKGRVHTRKQRREIALTPGLSPTGRNPRPPKAVRAPKAPKAPATPGAPPAPNGYIPPPVAPQGPNDYLAMLPDAQRARMGHLLFRGGDNANTIEGISNLTRQAGAGYADIDGARRRYMTDTGYEEGQGEGAIQDPISGKFYRLNMQGNPYSTAAQLQRSFEIRKKGSRVGAGSAGFLDDGAYAAEVAGDQQSFQQGVMGIATQTQDYLGQLASSERELFQQTLDQAFGLRQGQTIEDASTPKPANPNNAERADGGTPSDQLPRARQRGADGEYRRTETNGPNKGKRFKIVKNSQGRFKVFQQSGIPREKVS